MTALILTHDEGIGLGTIEEACFVGGSWIKGVSLPAALDGSSIAAIAYLGEGQQQIRIYYQANDLSLKEHCFTGKSWVPGSFRLFL